MSLRDIYIFDLDEPVRDHDRRRPLPPKEFDESREYAAVIVGAP